MSSQLHEEKVDLLERVNVAAMNAILGKQFKVLDHGFIRVIDYMGSDESIVQAARVSYGKGTKQVQQDQGLINYLMRHRHTTPFEMCEIKFHLKMPIFVARQWIRHRTANVNEYSGRYSIMSQDYYLPQAENIAPQSSTNKQGRDENYSMNHQSVSEIIEAIKNISEQEYQAYIRLLNQDSDGHKLEEDNVSVSRELARMVLGVNYYTEMYWKIDLHNLLHFLSLRADSHAQYEIRVYAEQMLDIVSKWTPMVYEAFNNYRRDGASLSKSAIEVIKRRLAGENVTQENSKMSKREWEELAKIIK